MKQYILINILLLALASGLLAQEERSLFVEKISLDGKPHTRESVIRNYLSFIPGSSITRKQLEQDKARLMETGFFKSVDLLLTPGSERGRAEVRIVLEEYRWPRYQFVSGFNELDGWYLHPISLRFDNLFGRGNLFGYRLILGDRLARSELEYVRPYFLGSEYNVEAQLFGGQRDFVHFVDQTRFKQQVRNGGLMLRISGNSGLPRFFSFAYVGEAYEADSTLTLASDRTTQIDAPVYISAFAAEKRFSRFILTLRGDTRNNRLFPTSGFWGSVSLHQVSEQTGEVPDYQKVIVDLRAFQSVYKQLTIAARLKYAAIDEEAPFYEKFYLGGPNSVRGYEDRSLTPPGYGAQLSQASAELRFPLSGRLKDPSRLSGVLFYDAGYAWNKPERWTWKSLETGLGYGLRIKLPIVGILRTDFAYSLPDYEFRFHLSLGHTF